MTVATQSESARQKLEAESFLRRVQVEYPHLVVLGYQAIINASVEGMKQLGVFTDNLNEATFLAGLRHSMDAGIVPKPPAPEIVPAQPSAEQLAEQAEQTRLAQIGREKEEAERIFNSEQSNPARHDDQPEMSTLDNAKSFMGKLRETVAKREAESLQVYRADGRVDHSKTEQLRKIFAHDKTTGAVLWTKTLELRKTVATNAEQDSRNRRDRF